MRTRRRLAGEGGFTLIELMVALVASATLFAATLLLMQSGQQAQARDAESALIVQEGRTGLARMVRDIRQAYKVEEAKASSIDFLATLSGVNYEIKYDCTVAQSGTTYTQCVRLAAEVGKALPGSGPPVVRYVVNGTAVFSYSPSSAAPNLATLKVELPAKGTLVQAGSIGYTHKFVLEDAAFMRYLYLKG